MYVFIYDSVSSLINRAVLKALYRPPGKAVHWGPYLHNHSQE